MVENIDFPVTRRVEKFKRNILGRRQFALHRGQCDSLSGGADERCVLPFEPESLVTLGDEEKAALLFLQRLTTLGYATFVLDANDIHAKQPVSSVTQIPEKQVLPQKINPQYIFDY